MRLGVGGGGGGGRRWESSLLSRKPLRQSGTSPGHYTWSGSICSRKGGQWAAGHIQLLTLLPNAAKSGREQSRFRRRYFVMTITCCKATLEPCSKSHTSISILTARCTNLRTGSVVSDRALSFCKAPSFLYYFFFLFCFLTSNWQRDGKDSTIYRI